MLGRNLCGVGDMLYGDVNEARRRGSGIFALERDEVGKDMFCGGPLKTKESQGFYGLEILGDFEVEGLCNRLVKDRWPVVWV